MKFLRTVEIANCQIILFGVVYNPLFAIIVQATDGQRPKGEAYAVPC